MSTATERKLQSLTQEGGIEVIRTFEDAIEIPGTRDGKVEEIKRAHEAGLKAMAGSLAHFSQAGQILNGIRDEVEDFSKWCKENLDFNRKTAYQYIKLHELCSSGKIDLESGEYTSIRQCLGIDHDGEKSTYQDKRQSDMRFESIPGLCNKVETFYKKAVGLKPIGDWSDDEKRLLAQSMKPIVSIYDELIQGW